MGWNANDKVMSKPIGMGDISQAVGNSSLDLGTLISSPSSRIWGISKMKPVPFPYPEPSRTQKVSAYSKTLWWWQGHPYVEEVAAGLVIGNYTTTAKCAWFHTCGLKILGFSAQIDALRAFDPSHNNFHDHSAASNPLWGNYSYIPPTGGINAEPFRMFDFDGYKSNVLHGIITDYETAQGTHYVNSDRPSSAKVKCSVSGYAGENTPGSLSIVDLFGPFGGAGFTVVLGNVSDNPATLVNLSRTLTTNTDTFKELEIDFTASAAQGIINKSVIGVYCATATYNNTLYYIPVMQSNNYCPNTPPNGSNLRVYKSWYVKSGSVFNMAAQCKYDYGTSNNWVNIPNASNISAYNRWYLKLTMPKKATTSYYVENTDFKIEFAGLFRNSYGTSEIGSYTITAADTRFVVKENEITNAADWGETQAVIIAPPGTGSKDCYMAIYNMFHTIPREGMTPDDRFVHGGTIYRIRIWFLDGQTEFAEDPDLEYGSLGSSGRLNITVPAFV